MRGESFDLGEALTPAAAGHLEAAWLRLREICAREGKAPRQASSWFEPKLNAYKTVTCVPQAGGAPGE